MSNLRDKIRFEIERGNFHEPFSVDDLRDLIARNQGLIGNDAPPVYLNSYLANHSIGPGRRQGAAVARGATCLFLKHGRALYSLQYGDYEFDPDSEDIVAEPKESRRSSAGRRRVESESGASSRKQSAVKTRSAIARRFVEYIRMKPYRMLKVRNGSLSWGPGPVTGWNDRVNKYEWKNVGWAATKVTLNKFTTDLASLEAAPTGSGAVDRAERIYEDIRKWGNPKGRRRSGQEVLALLSALWSGNPISEVDSTLTKLYALARPDDFAIYDSRVASAIMSIAEDIFRRRNIDTFHDLFPHLGLYNGDGGTRPRGYRSSRWPYAYRSVDAQMDANDLCRRVRDELNRGEEDSRLNWTLREVEAVLFMEGY